MALNIGINGLGRIGRELIYQIVTRSDTTNLKIVAVNDKNISDIEHALYFLNYNSTNLGRRTSCYFSEDKDNASAFSAYTTANDLIASGESIKFFNREGSQVDWATTGATVVIDCTGETNADYLSALYNATYDNSNPNNFSKVFFCGVNMDFPVHVPGVSSALSNSDTIVGLGDANSQALASILYILETL